MNKIHKNLIEALDEFLDISVKYRTENDEQKKEILEKKFNVYLSAVNSILEKYDGKQIEFTEFVKQWNK
jgi:hypothetical protein